MKPYGVRHDHHRYALNDNGKRDAGMTRWARHRERFAARQATIEEASEEAARRAWYGGCSCCNYDGEFHEEDWEDCVWCGMCLCCNCNGCVGMPHRPLTFRLRLA